jgi:hypothetical protein
MPSSPAQAEFDAMVARSGLDLPAEQRAALLAVWPAMQAMLDQVRAPAPGLAPLTAAAAAAEPAIIYRAAPGA